MRGPIRDPGVSRANAGRRSLRIVLGQGRGTLLIRTKRSPIRRGPGRRPDGNPSSPRDDATVVLGAPAAILAFGPSEILSRCRRQRFVSERFCLLNRRFLVGYIIDSHLPMVYDTACLGARNPGHCLFSPMCPHWLPDCVCIARSSSYSQGMRYGFCRYPSPRRAPRHSTGA